MLFRIACVLIATLTLQVFCAGAWAQVSKLQTTVKHRPTFVEADFGEIAKYVGELNSRTFELEPGVCALVTANWDKPLSAQQFYSAFLEIAQQLGYVVLEDGLVTRIQLAPDTPKDPLPPCRRYPVRNAG
jgi:type II secretory pathway component GspD/PulD (secretin)